MDVDAFSLVALELSTHRGVAEPGVGGDGVDADVAEHLLHDVLGDALVQHAGGHRVAELV